MPSMTPERWEYLESYSREVFGAEDENLSGLMAEAVAAGLPDIAVGPDVGRLLGMLTSLTRGRLAIEVGTLAGYSGTWIARGLDEGGRLVSIESEPKHAAFARQHFERAGVGHLIEIRVGPGVEILAKLVEELAPQSVDVLFLDAAKSEYSDYFQIARPLIVPGGLVIADNIYATGRGWIDEGWGTDEFNRLVAADPGFDTVGVPLRQGLLIARRRS